MGSPGWPPRGEPSLPAPAPAGPGTKARASFFSARKEIGAMDDEGKARSRPRALSPSRTCLSVGVALEELALLAAAAAASSMPTSCWVRYHALRVAAGVSRAPGPFKPRATRHSTAKLTQTASAQFPDEEYEAIVEHARACGLTVGSLIRRLGLGAEPIAHLPARA